jgi:hypothetical protein
MLATELIFPLKGCNASLLNVLNRVAFVVLLLFFNASAFPWAMLTKGKHMNTSVRIER